MAKKYSIPTQLPLPLEGITMQITLRTKGYTTVIDAVDADLSSIKWYPKIKPNGRVYAQANLKSRKVLGTSYLHRVIFARVLGRDLLDSELVDHEDNNSLNNRRENLRLATNAENMRHRGGRNSNNTSGVLGVRHSSRYKWTAFIGVDNDQIQLGSFTSFEAACEARREAEIQYWGEFAPK